MRRLDAMTLAAIARNVLEKYNPTLIHGEPKAIPIEDIVERHYGLNMEYRHFRKQGNVLGCAVFNDTLLPIWNMDEKRYELLPVKRGTIVISAELLNDRTDGRLRYTVAHELAHWLIHQELYSGGNVAAASSIQTSLEIDSVVERQADILACALLMPSNQVKRAYYAIRGAKDPASTLAGLFCVSKQAMGIFLKEHCLV